MGGRSAQTGASFFNAKEKHLTCKSSDHRPALWLCSGEDSRRLRAVPESPSLSPPHSHFTGANRGATTCQDHRQVSGQAPGLSAPRHKQKADDGTHGRCQGSRIPAPGSSVFLLAWEPSEPKVTWLVNASTPHCPPGSACLIRKRPRAAGRQAEAGTRQCLLEGLGLCGGG